VAAALAIAPDPGTRAGVLHAFVAAADTGLLGIGIAGRRGDLSAQTLFTTRGAGPAPLIGTQPTPSP